MYMIEVYIKLTLPVSFAVPLTKIKKYGTSCQKVFFKLIDLKKSELNMIQAFI